MNLIKSDDRLHVAITTLGATPDGFTIADRPVDIPRKAANGRTERMILKGELFRVKLDGEIAVHYFTNSALASAFRTRRIAAQRPATPSYSGPAKPAPKISKDAEIVTPPSAKFRSYPFVDLRAVSVPMARMGSVEWRAGVGGGV